jgi:hypothetical protein
MQALLFRLRLELYLLCVAQLCAQCSSAVPTLAPDARGGVACARGILKSAQLQCSGRVREYVQAEIRAPQPRERQREGKHRPAFFCLLVLGPE